MAYWLELRHSNWSHFGHGPHFADSVAAVRKQSTHRRGIYIFFYFLGCNVFSIFNPGPSPNFLPCDKRRNENRRAHPLKVNSLTLCFLFCCLITPVSKCYFKPKHFCSRFTPFLLFSLTFLPMLQKHGLKTIADPLQFIKDTKEHVSLSYLVQI